MAPQNAVAPFFQSCTEGIRQTQHRLPHWQQIGGSLLCDFSFGRCVPQRLLLQWGWERQMWLEHHPEPWSARVEREYHERFSRTIESWLDVGYGTRLLRRHDCAMIVANTLRYFDGVRVMMISFVVMPNHVHALFVLNPEWLLDKIAYSWKRFTAGEVNKLARRSGPLSAGLF